MNTPEPSSRDVVHEAIMEVLPHLEDDEIQDGLHLSDMGANSLDRTMVIDAIMARVNLDVPMSEFGRVADIGGLIDFVERVRRA
jgi:polyketide biosynthesis acyl carrier protein